MSATPGAASRGEQLALLCGASLAVATSAPMTRVAVAALPAALVACGRVLLAGLALLALRARSTPRAWLAADLRTRRGMVLAGLVLGAHFWLWVAAVEHTSIAAAVALVSLEPLCVVLAAWALLREAPSRGQLAGVALAMAGAAITASAAGGGGQHHLSGDLLALGSAALYALYVVAARDLRRRVPLVPYVTAAYLAAALALALASALPLASHAQPATHARDAALLAVVGLALVPTLVGHTLINACARRLAPALTAMISPGETVGAVLLSVWLLGERLAARELVGGGVILAGVAVAAFSPRAREPAPES